MHTASQEDRIKSLYWHTVIIWGVRLASISPPTHAPPLWVSPLGLPFRPSPTGRSKKRSILVCKSEDALPGRTLEWRAPILFAWEQPEEYSLAPKKQHAQAESRRATRWVRVSRGALWPPRPSLVRECKNTMQIYRP